MLHCAVRPTCEMMLNKISCELLTSYAEIAMSAVNNMLLRLDGKLRCWIALTFCPSPTIIWIIRVESAAAVVVDVVRVPFARGATVYTCDSSIICMCGRRYADHRVWVNTDCRHSPAWPDGRLANTTWTNRILNLHQATVLAEHSGASNPHYWWVGDQPPISDTVKRNSACLGRTWRQHDFTLWPRVIWIL